MRLAAGVEVSDLRRAPPDWAHLLPDRRPCTPDELPAGYAHGTRYIVPLVDMPVYLAYLAARLVATGGTILIETVASLDDVVRDAPLIVNRTGLGARPSSPTTTSTPSAAITSSSPTPV